jgi:hypothetical protein
MGSLEAMTKGSDARYLGDTLKLKVAQGVAGAVADKGSVLRCIPYYDASCQARIPGSGCIFRKVSP